MEKKTSNETSNDNYVEKYIDKSLENIVIKNEYNVLENKVDSNKELISEKFDSFDIKLKALESQFSNGIDSINNNINNLKSGLDAKVDSEVKIKSLEISNSVDAIKNNPNIRKLLGDALDDAIFFVKHPKVFVLMIGSMFLLSMSPYLVPIIINNNNDKTVTPAETPTETPAETKDNLFFYQGDTLNNDNTLANKEHE